MKIKILAAFAVITSLIACQKEKQSDSSSSGVMLGIKAINSSSVVQRTQASASRIQSASIQWNNAKASANLLKFEAKSNGNEIEFKSQVQQTIDLFNVTVALGNISIPAGDYTEVEFKAGLVAANGGSSLEMNGQVSMNNSNLPVVFRTNETIEVKGEKHNITIANATLNNATIVLDLAKIVNGITAADIASAALTNGTIIISPSDNVTLYNKIVMNLRNLNDECDFH